MTAPLTLERCAELRKKWTAATRDDVFALLSHAEALLRLEKWLRAEDWRLVESSAVVGEGEVQVTLLSDCRDPEDQAFAQEAANDLPSAILSALAKAEERL